MKIFKPFSLILAITLFACGIGVDNLYYEPEPTITAQNLVFDINENPNANMLLGEVDAMTTFGELRYYLASESVSQSISVNENNGKIKVNNVNRFNYEINPVITGTIRIENIEVLRGLTKIINFRINLIDVVEQITVDNETVSIDENSANGTSVVTMNATFSRASISFAIQSQSNSGALTIDATSGEITIADNSAFDYETNTSLNATIRVSGDDVYEDAMVTVNINNIDDAIITASNFTTTVDENSANGTSLGTVSGTSDQGACTFAIQTQSPTGSMSINASTGELTIANSTNFDYETNTTITATIRVSKDSLYEDVSATITLNDLVETVGCAFTASPLVTADLLAYYPFTNGCLEDKSSSSNHGTAVGTITQTSDRFGNPNSAYTFVNGHVNTADFDSPNASELTISAWIKDNGTPASYACIASKAGIGREFVVRLQSGKKLHSHYYTPTPHFTTSPTDVTSNVWTHIAFRFNNGVVTLFEDGVQVAQSTFTDTAISQNANIVTLGALTTGGSERFQGDLDDLAFYGRALTDAEILTLASN